MKMNHVNQVIIESSTENGNEKIHSSTHSKCEAIFSFL